MEVPLINFSKCSLNLADEQVKDGDLKEAGYGLYRAFNSSGFVYLKDHGIPAEKIEGIYEVAGRFFSRPIEEKQKNYNENTLTFCYDASEGIHASTERPADAQEGFRVTSLDDETVWPDVPHLRERVEEFQDLFRRLAIRVLRALGHGLKLKDPNYLCNCHQLMNKPGNLTMMKLLTYPPVTEQRPLKENQLRLGEHTDVASITILFQDDIGGLQVKNSKGEFMDAPPIPDTVVLNIADCLQFWSGGRLKSTVHRVVPPTDPEKAARRRMSFTYFAAADHDVVLKPFEFEDGVDEEGESDAKHMTCKEYMLERRLYFFRDKLTTKT